MPFMTSPSPVPPFVSILVPTRDNPELLRQVVRGVLANTRPPFELVVLDNASTHPDVTGLLAEISNDPRVKVVRFPENRFYWLAINEGLRRCDRACSLVVALNDDCVILGPTWIERLEESFGGRTDVGFVGDLMSDTLFPTLHPLVDGYCAMFRREVFDVLGGFDERFPFWWGFADFQLRAWKRGIRGGDIKRPGDGHHLVAGVVRHLRGQTLSGVEKRLSTAERKRVFGDALTKARLLARNGYYRQALALLMRQATGRA